MAKTSWRATVAILMTGGAMSASAALPESALSAEALRLLDPTRQMLALCGGKRGPGEALRARLAAVRAAGLDQVGMGTPPPLIAGLEAVRYKVSTGSALAQRYFDQGLALVYGFNHGEAIRAFREAQRLDPECAMCFWGEALAYGVNINASMDPSTNASAVKAAARAMALRGKAGPAEQALIEALAPRYAADAKAERGPLETGYAERMRAVAARFPDDDDIAILAAESIMNTQPWDYWEADQRTPKGGAGEAIALVEKVLARNPDHIQGAHLYIHLMEASAMVAKAEPYADRLGRPSAPGSGHLVHMPGHIYYRLGRFRDSIRLNVAAARVDEAYLRGGGGSAMYRYGYYPHNVHFIVTSAQMAGDLATAIAEADKLATTLADAPPEVAGFIQTVAAAPYYAFAQAAEPAQILALKPPPATRPYPLASWHYARAVAHALLGDTTAARADVEAIAGIAASDAMVAMEKKDATTPKLVKLARLVAEARLAEAEGKQAEAIARYRDAITVEAALAYTEPPYWYYPVRQSLGAALFRAGDYEGARQAFLEALAQSPANGWVLHGLAEAQRKLGDATAAAATQAAFERAWLGDPKWLKMERL